MRVIAKSTLDAMQVRDPIAAEIWRAWVRAGTARIVEQIPQEK